MIPPPRFLTKPSRPETTLPESLLHNGVPNVDGVINDSYNSSGISYELREENGTYYFTSLEDNITYVIDPSTGKVYR